MREGLRLYGRNPVLIVPPAIWAIVTFTTSSIIISQFAPEGIVPVPRQSSLVSVATLIFLLGLVNITTGFLVVLGQAGMTGRVVLEGATRLRHWGASIRSHFFTVLGLGIVYGGIVVVIGAAMGVLGVSVAFLSRSIPTVPPGTPPTAALPPLVTPLAVIYPLLMAISQSIFYILLASAVMDGRGIAGSLDYGLKVVKRGWRVYLPYLGVFIAVSLAVSLIGSFQYITQGGFSDYLLSPNVFISQGLNAVFSPFLFLLAFLIYRMQSTSSEVK